MKTTVDIANELFRRAKRVAGEQGITMREIIESALRSFLQSRAAPSRPFKLRKQPFTGRGLAPGVHEGDWHQMRASIYEGQGG